MQASSKRRPISHCRLLLRRCASGDYAGAIDDCLEGYAVSKSTVSRQWKEVTQKQLHELCARPIPADLVILFIDGKQLLHHHVIVAAGVRQSGEKCVLGLWDGASENATVVRSLLEEVQQRGLCTQEPILFVIDGAKALSSGIKQVFGSRAVIQRCRVHKQRNILEHLPKEQQPQAVWRLRSAWAKEDYQTAKKDLYKTVEWLQGYSEGAAKSLAEGLQETLTLQKLQINGKFTKSLSSTNIIESIISRASEGSARVKPWNKPKMPLRWLATILLHAETNFHRIHGYRDLPELKTQMKKLIAQEQNLQMTALSEPSNFN